MTEKQKQVVSNKPVLIMIKRGRRGYIVEAAGGGDPYPCLEASDIGEAVIEILEDPEQQTVEFTAPEPEKIEAAPPVEESEDSEGEDEGPGPRPNNVRPNGWTAGDELLVGLAGSLLSKARKFSDWDRS